MGSSVAEWGLAASVVTRHALTPLTLGIVLLVIGFVVAFSVATYVMSRRARTVARED